MDKIFLELTDWCDEKTAEAIIEAIEQVEKEKLEAVDEMIVSSN